jgi:dihydrodipicolinate synthase/N-acetylneuraminate lyase
VAFLRAGGVDGILALGTTGEGVLFSVDERKRAAELFLRARPAGFAVVVHCGAQSTRDTVALAAHAAQAGADAVAVIGPPYFPLDEASLLAHFAAAARACAPVPFYLYEFQARSGYTVPPSVLATLREIAPNLAGLKVSDTPFAAVEPYLVEGLDVFIGSEPLLLQGLERGAAGTVSGLATAFPEAVAGLMATRSDEAQQVIVRLREGLAHLPLQAALKAVLGERAVPVGPDVRAPLRGLTREERERAVSLLRETVRT